jgi:hypothetical protein
MHHRKHMSRDHHPPLRDVTAITENTSSSTVACAYFGLGLEMTSFYFCVLEHVYLVGSTGCLDVFLLLIL